ncbi:adenine phosphoribosyltransferase [Nitrogeniibacter mangrovi]|uniref:Adenine phosphoribosyltransferase n=1 Tax=Nitrogeniibacter mangrovi TaxID=2016596 RepID=A0A6C1B0T9_9RHOO|nr:adenine phosphoribosyltransferase [Nitrogeniibacter mangrovi]QID16448.1 adenine phosphoribosyltransferase [Nitrogeniibacter mangrovi]
MPSLPALLREHIRTIPDWPKPGVQFRDLTPLYLDAGAFRRVVDALVQRHAGSDIDRVAGIDARGFILGAVLAHALGAGFIPIRKQGKLPAPTIGEAYALEYGQGVLEVHTDAITPGQRLLLVDDLIATGGTLSAARRLIERLGGQLVEAVAIADLPDLGGSAQLRDSGLPIHTLIQFEGH